MSITDKLRQMAVETALQAQHRASELDAEIAGFEAQAAKLKAERDTLRLAPKRLANYPVKAGGDYLCPCCWVDHGGRSPLFPIPSDSNDDLFRCRMCHQELRIESKP
jgi:hypothetical protein